MGWTVDWKIEIGGKDQSQKLRKYLISIDTMDKDGETSDTCSLVLDDKNGQVKLPKGGETLKVWWEGELIFTGEIDDPDSSGSRSAGQKLAITAKGFDTGGKVKQKLFFNMDNVTLEEFMKEAGKRSGYELKVLGSLKGIKKPNWIANKESPIALGERMARTYGGIFKMRGKKGILTAKGEKYHLKPVTITINPQQPGIVLTWRVKTRTGRQIFASSETTFFNRDTNEFETIKEDFGNDGQAAGVVGSLVANKEEADQMNKARKRETESGSGAGTLTLDVTPGIHVGITIILKGARDGADGSYIVSGVGRKADRNGGSKITCNLENPHDGAGKDNRKATK